MLLDNINFKDENYAQNTTRDLIDGVKIKNIDNNFFSEIDLILESEKEFLRFKKKKNGIIQNIIFKISALLGAIDEKSFDKKIEDSFYQNLFNDLKENVIISELERLNSLNNENRLFFKLKDIEYILENKQIIKFMNDKGCYKKNFYLNILDYIEKEKPVDIKHYGKGKVKRIKRDINELM
jgi:hypothetical protein